MTTRSWRPIEPLEPRTEHDFSPDDILGWQWLNHRADVGNVGLTALHRSWAVETGIIEGLYRLDEDQTDNLVANGFEPSTVPTSGIGQDPDTLLAILQDHMTALDAIYGAIGNDRFISRSAIRQLHQVIVAHQPTYRAVNRFGQWFDARLRPGAFKTLPNNPTRPDGVLHEYCPPQLVDSELDNLLDWYGEYVAQPDVYHPLLVAAWLHHRFAQIHPFPDGNGRVTRALVTWHLVQHDHLPIVVTRHDRDDYIDALEAADDGNLDPLVEFTARLHRRSILRAKAT